MCEHLMTLAEGQDELLKFATKLQEMSQMLSNPIIPFTYNEVTKIESDSEKAHIKFEKDKDHPQLKQQEVAKYITKYI